MAIQTLLLALLAGSTSAVKLYISSYADEGATLGKIRTFDLALGLGGRVRPAASLKALSENQNCGSAPSWLEISGRTLYCIDEGFQTPNASLNTLTINGDGSLKSVAKVDTIQGPVANQFYNKKAAVALAHYGGSAISTFKTNENGSFTPLQQFVFNTPPGPRPEQEASHVHHTVIDPTSEFLVFPDLGADLVRVYKIDPATSLLTVQDPIKAAAASGPRHAVFWSPDKPAKKESTFLFVIHELSNNIVTYKVNYASGYGNSSLSFTKLQTIGLYGTTAQPNGTRAAEIVVSPDNKFIISSNRNATIFSVANPDPKNATKVPSDSLTTFQPLSNGTLKFVGLSPSGGSFPRFFSLNKLGNLVSVGNQNSGSVFIFRRDVETGKIGEAVATQTGLGQVTNIRWDE
ncbi:3-carboxy-cis,cis-mucoante lactonizing enzyme [Polyplosphaeria fusca]|uniref:3-carboxy-cis,cis-mucoante lactonizing enzyme n=1 Tax=Polyplosphaeria fusca TaxID=682080 RepID=A0A9P4RCZ9_9PLEO|nr:3-carboxy-cis,cis-mucoante lactonizing enzyme [Polyplosphaeria fusca]